MRSIIISGLVGLFSFSFYEFKEPSTVADVVYICDSPNSVAYHSNYSCSGLKKCTHSTISTTSSKAESVYKKRKCKICYNY